jgi:hypothetical protein
MFPSFPALGKERVRIHPFPHTSISWSKRISAYFFSADLRFMVEVASIVFSYNIQPFERQAHRRFSSRSRYGGMQLRIRMSLRVLLHALLQNHFSTLLLSQFLTLHCVGTNRLSISATG